MEKHPLHLKIPDLQTSPEVEKAVTKQEQNTGEDLPNDPNERIQAYMDRLENVFLNPNLEVRRRNLELFRPSIHNAYIIKPENVPESFFTLQQRVARERGQAVETIPENVREQMIATIIEDQKASLDSWLSYLTSEDAVYPPWFKYFVFRNILKLSQFDKELGKFKSRTETTTAPFPDIYREPLAQICDLYEQVRRDNKALKEPEIQSAFSKKFPTYYAELIQKSLANQLENQEEIKGQWVKYEQGNTEHAETLYKSLESKGTGWCTAGLSTAKAQMQSGDFYVYYTEVDGEPTQPRIAIRMNGTSEIGEVRGILPHQNLEGQMMPILTEKLKDFGPEAEKYQKKSADMKQLTEIEQKTMEGKPLTQADLLFLYEVNTSIDGFGYNKDPRIADIRSRRNLQEDLPVIFNCKPEQIANTPIEITPDTIVYIGPWNPTIMQKMPKTVTHIYESFPDKKVFLKEITPDPEITSIETAIAKLQGEGHQISDYAKDMLTKVNWQEKLKPTYEVVSFSVSDLFGDKNTHTYADIKTKAQELGLDLIPQALAPAIRLNYPKDGNLASMALQESIRDRDGNLRLFRCDGIDAESWLYNSLNGRDDHKWGDSHRFFFVRK
jgi:hypothetical protein